MGIQAVQWFQNRCGFFDITLFKTWSPTLHPATLGLMTIPINKVQKCTKKSTKDDTQLVILHPLRVWDLGHLS